MDMEVRFAQSLINWVGSLVREGNGSIDHDALGEEGIRLVDFHASHLRLRLFNSWTSYYGAQPLAGDFVQVLRRRTCSVRVIEARVADSTGLPDRLPDDPARGCHVRTAFSTVVATSNGSK